MDNSISNLPSYVFSRRSLERLAECHKDLQAIAFEMIKTADYTVLCGHRNEADQIVAFVSGASKVKWPNSKHNSIPSRAIDMAPCPVQWINLEPWRAMRAHAQAVADQLGIKIRFISWDYPHIELA